MSTQSVPSSDFPFEVELHPSGIVLITLRDEVDTVSLQHIIELNQKVAEAGLYRKRGVITIIKTFNTISPEARKFSASEESQAYTIANAIVVHSLATRLGANFYIQFSKPARPTKVFNDFDKALEWVKSKIN